MGGNDYSGEQVCDGIIIAADFAAVDPYRAATHNKGIMNGIDPVAIATGNDWRAIEAGAHAYAARGDRYTSLTKWWTDQKGNLCGSIEVPIKVGHRRRTSGVQSDCGAEHAAAGCGIRQATG